MKLAQGDTVNPIEFAQRGIFSPFGAAEATMLKVVRGEQTFAGLVADVDVLLEDCDLGHTRLMVSLPHDEDVMILARQWGLIAPKLSEQVSVLKTKAADPNYKADANDIARAATIYDLLLTRTMAFVLNSTFVISAAG